MADDMAYMPCRECGGFDHTDPRGSPLCRECAAGIRPGIADLSPAEYAAAAAAYDAYVKLQGGTSPAGDLLGGLGNWYRG